MGKPKRHTCFEQGQGLIEYALILVLVVIVAIVVLSVLGTAVGGIYSDIVERLQDPTKPVQTDVVEWGKELVREVASKPLPEKVEFCAKIISVAIILRIVWELITYLALAFSKAKVVGGEIGSYLSSAFTEILKSMWKIWLRLVTMLIKVLTNVWIWSKAVSANLAPAFRKADIALRVFQQSVGIWSKVVSANLALAFRKTDVALRIFQQLSTSAARTVWEHLIHEKLLIKNIKSENLLPFYRLACDTAQHLSSEAQLESFVKLGGLYNELASFDNALPAFKSAERLFYMEGAQTVPPTIQAALFSGLGTTYVRTEDDSITTLRWASEHFNKAQESVAEIEDEETRKAIEGQINDGRNQIGQKLPLVRKKQNAWAFATIEEHEEDHPLYLGETYTLTTGMGWEAEPGMSKTALIQLPEPLDSFEFDISVWAEDMEIEPLWIRTLELDPTSDSPSLIHFELTPKAVGQKVIKVDFYYQLHWLQQITFEVEVMESPLIMPDITDEAVVRAQPLKVGMLLGLGGLGDKSFNDSAYAGLEEARQRHGIEFETADSGRPEESIALLQQWAEAGYDLIIALGFHNGPAIVQVAESFPEKRFAIVETKVKGENVWSVVFREYEADYVVGALAALIAGKGGRLGFIGGVRTPIIHRIEAAFSQGIKSMNLDITLNTIYVDRFDNEVMGQYFAEILYAMGADVVYQAAGRSGMGAIRAARKLGRFIISTGGDHSVLAPDAVLTSRIKNVHRPVLDVIEAVVKDQFEGGKTVSYGLANGGLSLAPIRPEVVKRLVERLPPDVTLDNLRTRMQEVTEAVARGQIVVDFDEVEETISELAAGKSPDEKSLDKKSTDDDDSQHST